MMSTARLHELIRMILDLLTTIMLRLAFWGGVFYQMYRTADYPLIMFSWLAGPVAIMYVLTRYVDLTEPVRPRRVDSAGSDE